MSADPDKCCGKCKHFSPNPEYSAKSIMGDCMAPIPENVLVNDGYSNHYPERRDLWPMFSHEGEACPCFSRREEKENHG